jgi:hypothetical protein
VAINRERNTYEEMVASLDALAPTHSLPVMVDTDFLPSITFYRGQLSTIALCGKRETHFQPEESYRKFYLETAEDVGKHLRTRPRLFVVVPPAASWIF